MAGAFAIGAVGKAIISLLTLALPSEFAGTPIELVQSANLNAPPDDGIGIYLYRLTPANNLRNLPPRVDAVGRRYYPSFPIDLHYLLIAYARDTFKQQRLLGWAIRTIEDSPILPASLLNKFGGEFEENDAIDILFETLSVQDMGTVWDVARHHMQPAAAYMVRMLSLASTLEMIEADRVQTRVFDAGKVVTP